MENKACGKEAGAAQGWMTSSPTYLAVDSSASWAARGAAPATEAEGEEKTWSTHSSKTKLTHSHTGNGNLRGFILKATLFVMVSFTAFNQAFFFSTECHWKTFTMEKQLNYSLARTFCVALVTGKFAVVTLISVVNPVIMWFLTVSPCLGVHECRQGGKTGAVQKCTTCRGRGMRIMIRQLAPGMVQQMQSVCTDCNGEGNERNDPNCEQAFTLHTPLTPLFSVPPQVKLSARKTAVKNVRAKKW